MTKEEYKKAIKNRYMSTIDIQEMSINLYNACKDFDFSDYEDTSEKDREQLEEALYYLSACADNEYNADYFRVLMFALALVFKGV